jgi:hypothetical protein
LAHDVFISHSSKDKPIADAVCARLESRGIRCWIAPRDVEPGRPYGESIIDAIHNCRIMVLLLSSSANTSIHIAKEVERAVSHGATVIPLRIEAVMPAKSLDYFIGSVHWLDALTPPLEQHLDNLAEAILRILQVPRQPEIPVGGKINSPHHPGDCGWRRAACNRICRRGCAVVRPESRLGGQQHSECRHKLQLGWVRCR